MEGERTMNTSTGGHVLQTRARDSLRLGALCLLLGCAGSSQAFAQGTSRPAIANTPACNSSKVVFMPTFHSEARSLAFVKALPGVHGVGKNPDGTYTAEFGSAKDVNALINDLNQHHAAQVIDLFQFFQCKYGA